MWSYLRPRAVVIVSGVKSWYARRSDHYSCAQRARFRVDAEAEASYEAAAHRASISLNIYEQVSSTPRIWCDDIFAQRCYKTTAIEGRCCLYEYATLRQFLCTRLFVKRSCNDTPHDLALDESYQALAVYVFMLIYTNQV